MWIPCQDVKHRGLSLLGDDSKDLPVIDCVEGRVEVVGMDLHRNEIYYE